MNVKSLSSNFCSNHFNDEQNWAIGNIHQGFLAHFVGKKLE